jgi:hypothetical protein
MHSSHSVALLTLTLAVAASLGAVRPAHAQMLEPPAPRHEVHASIGASNFGGEAELGYQLSFPSGASVGAAARGAYGDWFVAGLPVERAATLGGELRGEIPVRASGRRRLLLRGALGARTTAGDLTNPASGAEVERSLAPTIEVGARAVVAATDDLDVHVGLAIPVALAVAPSTELEELGQLLELGLERRIGDRVSLSLRARAGGMYGYGGDGAKLEAGADLGVRVSLDGPRTAPVEAERDGGVGAFVATEWRIMGLAGHTSHGPGAAVGVTLLGGHLKLGLVTHARPGPLNPTTFAVSPASGASYKGRSELALRSDGAFVGALVAPSFGLPGAPAIDVEIPVAFGQSAYGFYLSGDDRVTPDGRRVSEWEDELFEGKDSSPAFGGEIGLKIGIRLPGGLKPYAAFRHAFTLGFDTVVKDDYGGPTGALGVEVEM